MPLGCVGVHFADHVARYFDEIVDYEAVGLRVLERDVERIPAVLETALESIEELQRQTVCACQATLTPLSLSGDAHFQELRRGC